MSQLQKLEFFQRARLLVTNVKNCVASQMLPATTQMATIFVSSLFWGMEMNFFQTGNPQK